MNLDLSTGLPELHDSSLRWYVGAKTEFNGFGVSNGRYTNTNYSDTFVEIQREMKVAHLATTYKRFLFWDFQWGTRTVEEIQYTTVKRRYIVMDLNDHYGQTIAVPAESLTPELILKEAKLLYEEYTKGLSALELMGAYPPKKLIVGETDE